MLQDFISEEEKEKLKQNQEDKIKKVKEKLIAEGLSEYQANRKIEEIFMKPDSLPRFENNKIDLFEQVSFFFDEKEFEEFTKVFRVSRYLETTCNQTWILLDICKLIADGKLTIDPKEKKLVTTNG